MANLRIIRKNVVDAATSLTASSNAGGTLVAANMQNDYKGVAHRSAATTVTYTATWSTAVTVGGLGIPAINLTSGATIRGRLYSDTACTALIVDSGTVTACPDLVQELYGWSGAYTANSFAIGGLAKTALWFTSQPANVKGCKIDIVDAGNTAGFIDCSRLVIGPYWEPTKQADYGVKITPTDTTENKRNDAGDLRSDVGTYHDQLTLDLKQLPEADRAELVRLMRYSGTRGPVFLSVLPDNSLSALEQDHMIYGKRDNEGAVFTFFDQHNSSISINGW